MSRFSRRRLLACALGAAGICSVGFAARPRRGGSQVVKREGRALGTSISLTVIHSDHQLAHRAAEAALAEVQLVDRLMSLYRPDSQLCRLNANGRLDSPHPYLVSVLHQAQQVSARSNGAFDVTVQPLWELYSAARRTGSLPDGRRLEAAVRKVNWRDVEVASHRIRLRGHSTAVTLNGIAQGFAADRALAALERHGIHDALLDTGEIGSLGRPASARPWSIGIQHPRYPDAYLAVAALEGRCLSTSADYATSFSADHRDNHLFDPRTGRSPTVLASVSVVAPTATEADALSTAAYVLEPEDGLHLVESTPGAEVLMVFKDGRTLASAGFPAPVS